MEELVKTIIEKLSKKGETIATMESCTGGFLASTITDQNGASDIFHLGLVTYQTQMKEKFGVSKKVIEEYTVYSKETAEEMAKTVSNIAESNYGIGITGQIGRADPNEPGNQNEVFYSIFNKKQNMCYTYKVILKENYSRSEKKKIIVEEILKNLLQLF